MKTISRFAVTLFLIFAFLTTALPCGPSYVTPIFVNTSAPENPYAGYAAGRLGIINKGYRRTLLYAAYRYVGGGTFTPDEQKALIELWKSDIDRRYTRSDEMTDIIKAWIDKRKEVVGKEEKTPDIYVERSYSGYDFFPNCTQNAFEVATETLADRTSAHGPNDSSVKDWLKAQDDVFSNCSSGKRTPDDPAPGAPDWLQKDRAYQKAAAAFYAMDYPDAKTRFAQIAQDTESPWRETADYLVARTLIRQASLTKSDKSAEPFYQEAEERLRKFVGGSGKFAASAGRMDGLIQYRLHPKDRVSQLAKKLAFQSGDENFKQDVIDYTWLMDKFEHEAIMADENRKAQAEAAKTGTDDRTIEAKVLAAVRRVSADAVSITVKNGEVTISGIATKEQAAEIIAAATAAKASKVNNELGKTEDSNAENDLSKIEFTLYSDDYAQNWIIVLKPDATDDEALAAAERAVGKPLTEEMKKRVRDQRQSAYVERFSKGRQSEYEGGYNEGGEKLTMSLLPDVLKNDDLSNWLFVFQMKPEDSYAYSLKRYHETNSDLWLMTALTKANKSSDDLKSLLDAADGANRTGPGYQTIVYHAARIYLELGKDTEARKLIEPMLDAGSDVPISVRNQFIALRLHLAQTIEDYLTDSLRKPYGFDYNGTAGSVDEIIAEQKSYYDPESNKDGREAYDREIENNFKTERMWQDRLMFDTGTVGVMNQNFSQSVMLQVEKSPALPDYLRSRFAIAIWTRAYLLEDWPTLLKITPEIVKYEPQFADGLQTVVAAKTPAAQRNAALYFILKNPLFSPYLEDGMGKTDNEFGSWDSNDWWCALYTGETDSSETTDSDQPTVVQPKFLTAAQKQAATVEKNKIAETGDAPALLATRVLEWAARSPSDPRVPESLYIVHQANGWTKYGCGNSEELQKKVSDLMNKTYPQSEWTRKLTEDANEK